MIQYQQKCAKSVICVDTFRIEDVRLVGGVDISFEKGTDRACAYITVMDYKTLGIVYEDHEVMEMKMPYISGLLGFREVPIYKVLLERLKREKGEYYPDVVMVDGCGVMHHRGFGSASHLGYELGLPTVGVNKSFLCLDGLDERVMKGEFREKCKRKGDFVELVGKSGKVYGAGVKTSDDTINPVFVSVGHKVSLGTAVEIVMGMSVYKIPEPIRNSDIKSKVYLL